MITVTRDLVIIDLFEPWTTCSRCGKETPHRWGLPIDCETGDIVPNCFEGEWGGMPACKACYEWHQAWSDRIESLLRSFDAPLA